MLTASCPKCAKQVTVPSAARPESRVRCPLCAEEYSLESVFADLPPLLVLLDAPVPNGTSGIHAEEPILAASASGVGGSSSIFDFGAREQADAAHGLRSLFRSSWVFDRRRGPETYPPNVTREKGR